VLMHIRYYTESYFELKLDTGTFRPSDTKESLEALSSIRFQLAFILDNLWFNALMLLGVLLFMLILRVITRRDWLAIAAFILLGTGLNVLGIGRNPLVVTLLVAIVFAVNALVMFRGGLLMSIAYAVFSSHFATPIAANLNTWYSVPGLVEMGIVFALAIYAFHTSLGGQKVFTGKLLDE
jgi:hypothetical protein